MKEAASSKLQKGFLKGLNTLRNIKDDSAGVFGQLVDRGVEAFAKSGVPNEELHYNKEAEAQRESRTVEAEQKPNESELLKKLCACTDAEFELLKKMIAEAEVLRDADKK